MYDIAKQTVLEERNKKSNEFEFKFNVARNYQFLGHNCQAYQIYTELLESFRNYEGVFTDEIKQIKTMTAFNLSLLFKKGML